MRNTASRALIILAVLCTAAAQSQQKLAQTGMKFLNVGTDARAVSLGEAVTSVEFNSAAMFYNPASMARLPHAADIRFCNTRFIADIQHYAGNIALAPAHGDYGVLGFFVHYVDYGLFQGTVRADNEQGYLETGAFSPSAFTVGASYARALNDKFSVGGSAKFVRQELGPSANAVGPGGFPVLSENSAEVMAFDFGILYRTGFKSLNFGMVVRNFSKEVKYEKEGFQLPLTFKIGLSMNLVDLMSLENPDHALLLSFDAEHPAISRKPSGLALNTD